MQMQQELTVSTHVIILIPSTNVRMLTVTGWKLFDCQIKTLICALLFLRLEQQYATSFNTTK